MRLFQGFPFYIYIIINSNFLTNVVSNDCQIQGRNFELLSANSPWLIWNNSHGMLEISLCKPLANSSCGENVSVCYYDVTSKVHTNFGNYGSITPNSEKTFQFSIQMEGENCIPENTTMVTTILFRCGKSLGYPKFVPSKNACRIILEWHSTVSCLEKSKLAEIQTTKCYGYNSNNLLINIGLLDDEYEIELGDDKDDDDDDDGLANFKDGTVRVVICRNMDSDESCPGAAACLDLKNQTKLSLGKVSTPLIIKDDDTFSISYLESNSQITGCRQLTTTINFLCPQLGIGSVPLLLSSSNCFINIKWETEAACSVQSTTTNSSCLLSNNKHIIDFNMLRSDEPHELITTNFGGDVVKYQFHLCSQRLISCGSFNSSACQINLNNSNVKSIGNFSEQTFRYSDGALQMVLEGGEPCGTGFSRNTIINFHCDRSSTSNGSLSFAYEDMCTYVFDWNTTVACLTPSIPCSLKLGNITFDVSSLIKIGFEENWRTADNSTILNICRGLVPSDSMNCSSGAICRKVGTKYVNYGRRMLALTFNKTRGAIQLDYVDGDLCYQDNRRHNATLLIYCDPSAIISQPYLVSNYDDECHISLEWYSSAACGSGHTTGVNCQVKDHMTALQFDLSPLKLLGPTIWSYNVTSDALEYDYFINICAPLRNTPCSQNNTGVCQVSKKNSLQMHSTGEWNDELHYMNGVLKLIYKHGDNYNSNPVVARHTDIEFVCNSRVGLGTPLFVMETNRTYKFLWHTILACPNDFDKCSSLTSEGKVFDLSFLVQQGSRKNWQLLTSLAGKPFKLLLNLCRGLLTGPEIKSCDPLHSACLIALHDNETISLGRPLVRPLLKADVVIITYEGGTRCKQDSNSYYSLELQLHCTNGNAQSNPSSFEPISPCKFVVKWFTSVACPNNNNNNNNNFSVDNCSLKLDQSGQLFEVTRFKNLTFNVTAQSTSYKISLCGESSECGAGVAACRMDGKIRKEVVLVKDRKYSINTHGMPQMQLTSDEMKILVHFICNPSETNGSLAFVESRSDWLLFSFTTNSVCFVRTVVCQVFDQMGNKYDLDPLVKVTGSWTAFSFLLDSCDFNLCRPLPSTTEASCLGAGSCLKSRKTGEVMNGGEVSSLFEVTSVGVLRVKYTGGSACGERTRSTLIILKCSSAGHEPILLSDVNDCEALIQWDSPFACPINDTKSVGKNCQVRHPLHVNQMFDLSLLKRSRDYEVDFDVGKYLIRVCSEVQTDESCKNTKAGACFIVESETFNMGNYSDLLEYKDGRLSLNYSNILEIKKPSPLEQCKDGVVSTQIDFKCEHDNLGLSSGPIYLSGFCHRKFEWVTSLACFKYQKVLCRIDDGNGIEFDLSHLMLHDSNYEVYVDGRKIKFIINVCSTLVHTEGNSCPPDSAACMVDMTTKKSTSIGLLGNAGGDDDDQKNILSMDGEKVKLVYKGVGGVMTIIYFMCDSSAPETTTPRHLITEGNNTFIFMWSTKLMCTEMKHHKQTNDCSVLDTESGHLYDLTPLKKESPYLVEAFGQSFFVFVCSCQLKDVCPTDWLLTYEHEKIFLRYSGGQTCEDPSKNSSTVVSFVCPDDDDKEELQFVLKNDDCMHVFRWFNKIACKKELKCLVLGSGHNLSPLINHDSMYTAKISTNAEKTVSEVFINICTPVLAEAGCKKEAGVCFKMKEGQILNGGIAKDEPKYDESSHQVLLNYLGGDSCSDNRRWSSKIIFFCSKMPDLTPTLSSIDNALCLLTFHWKTDLVCQSSLHYNVSSFLKDCRFNLEDNTYDFNNISIQLASQKIPSQKGIFEIRLCSEFGSGSCSLSAVCLLDSSGLQVKGYGIKSEMVVVAEGKDIKLYFLGRECHDGSLNADQASLIFSYDSSSTIPSIQIIHESNCSITINFKTHSFFSLYNTPAFTTIEPTHPDEITNGSSGHGSYTPYVIVAVIAVCVLFITGMFICRKKRNQRGYEPVATLHYSRDCDEQMQSPLCPTDDGNDCGLQNYTSDDDLML